MRFIFLNFVIIIIDENNTTEFLKFHLGTDPYVMSFDATHLKPDNMRINLKNPFEKNFADNLRTKEEIQPLSPGDISEQLSDVSERKKRTDSPENRLYKENNTVIPYVRKFISKLKNSSSLRNIFPLKSANFTLLNDPTAFLDKNLEAPYSQRRYKRIFFNIKAFWIARFKAVFKSAVFEMLSKHIRIEWFLLHPYQNLRIFWDMLHLLLIGFWLFYIPAVVAFEEIHKMDLSISFYTVMFLIFDILLKFNTSYFKNGIQETRYSKISSHYLCTRFMYDLIPVLPLALDLTFDGIINRSDFSEFRVLHYIKFLFFIKISTFQKISNRILEKFLLKEKFQNIFALLKVFSVSLLVAHVFACFWYLTADISLKGTQDSWIVKAGLIDSDWKMKYLYAIYWACVTMMTVGYGDITPQNENEIVICMVSIILGCAVYAYNINSIGMILQDLNKENAEFAHKINVINQFMSRKNINKDLQMRIREYLRFIWKEENTQNLEDEQKVIGLLSAALKEELLIEAYGTVLQKNPMFFTNFSEKSLRKVVSIIRDIKLFPDEKVFLENEEDGDFSIFFVMKGKVEIFSNASNSEFPVRTLKVGEHFGEIGFFTGKSRLFSVKSKDFTTLFAINREEFMEVLRKNSDDFEKFCMIKDQILLYGNYYPLRLRCYCCNQTGHIASSCPLIHYLPDNEKIIKAFNYYTDQQRFYGFNRKFRKQNARFIKNQIVLASEKINEKNSRERESLVQEMISLNSSTDQDFLNEVDEEIKESGVVYDIGERINEAEEKDESCDGSNGSTGENIERTKNVNRYLDMANLSSNNSLLMNMNAHNGSSGNLEDEQNNPNDPNNLGNELKLPRDVVRRYSLSHGHLPEEIKPIRKNTQKHTLVATNKTTSGSYSCIARENSRKQTHTVKTNIMNSSNVPVSTTNINNINTIVRASTSFIDRISIDKVRNFKNYFPENNCKTIFERLNNTKPMNLRHLKKLKSMEFKLAKYTFFPEDLKTRMPDEIRKRKKLRKKSQKRSMYNKLTEKNKSINNRELLLKMQKRKRGFFSGDGKSSDMKFSDVVKLIMLNPNMQKIVRKSKKSSIFGNV